MEPRKLTLDHAITCRTECLIKGISKKIIDDIKSHVAKATCLSTRNARYESRQCTHRVSGKLGRDGNHDIGVVEYAVGTLTHQVEGMADL